MTFLQHVEGCRAHTSDVGPFLRFGSGSTVPVKVWAFTDRFLVAHSPQWRWRRAEPIASPGATITPDGVASMYRQPMLLERNGLFRIDVGSRRPRGRQAVLGVDHAIFEFLDGGEFDLMVWKKRTDDLLPVLRVVYPGKVRDCRKDR